DQGTLGARNSFGEERASRRTRPQAPCRCRKEPGQKTASGGGLTRRAGFACCLGTLRLRSGRDAFAKACVLSASPDVFAPPSDGLSLRAITRRFGQRLAVDGVSLDVRRGEVLCLL